MKVIHKIHGAEKPEDSVTLEWRTRIDPDGNPEWGFYMNGGERFWTVVTIDNFRSLVCAPGLPRKCGLSLDEDGTIKVL